MRLASTLIAFVSAGLPSSAEMFFDWPVDCTQGVDCYIQQFVDHDQSTGARDFTCGSLSYDGHKGTDIALATRDQMSRGVGVLAAAPGVVIGKRDGLPDSLFVNGTDLEGRDCGNGVVIDHGDGWHSQYCHLRQGTVRVGRGAQVLAGQMLGEIGLSGRSQFVHLDFSIRKDDQIVDPFAPQGAQSCQDPNGETLWTSEVAYVPGGVLDLGFADAVPQFEDVKAGTASRGLSQGAPLVLFALVYGARQGDVLRMLIDGPEGRVFQNDVVLDRTQAQIFRAGGRRAPDGDWPIGRYAGIVELRRDGAVISVLSGTASID